MGIRFTCHHCGHALHVKDFQAGKRGRCPDCQGQFRIPNQNALVSMPIEERPAAVTSMDDNGLSQSDQASTLIATRKKRSASSPAVGDDSASTVRTQSTVPTEVRSGAPTSVEGTETVQNNSPVVDLPMPAVLTRAIDARWHVRPPSGGQYGPASSRLLMDWISERRITPDSLLWCDGMAQWEVASVLLPELFDASSVTPQPSLPTPPSPPVAVPSNISIPTSQNTSSDSWSGMGDLAQASSFPNNSVDTSLPAVQAAAIVLKRKRQQKQQFIIVVLLGILSLVLISVLVVVLVQQASKAKTNTKATSPVTHRAMTWA